MLGIFVFGATTNTSHSCCLNLELHCTHRAVQTELCANRGVPFGIPALPAKVYSKKENVIQRQSKEETLATHLIATEALPQVTGTTHGHEVLLFSLPAAGSANLRERQHVKRCINKMAAKTEGTMTHFEKPLFCSISRSILAAFTCAYTSQNSARIKHAAVPMTQNTPQNPNCSLTPACEFASAPISIGMNKSMSTTSNVLRESPGR
jgi:hypothetical protein